MLEQITLSSLDSDDCAPAGRGLRGRNLQPTLFIVVHSVE